MSNPGSHGSTAGWLLFHDNYRRLLPQVDFETAAYELFNYFRDSTPALWLREIVKAFYHAWLTWRAPPLNVPRDQLFDYCFIVDGTGVNGLTTSLPLLRALPAGQRALVVVRDYVTRDARFAALRDSQAFTVVNADRSRPRALRARDVLATMRALRHAYPRSWVTVPQLSVRREKYQHVVDELLAGAHVRHLVVSNERLMLSSVAILAARRRGVHTACLQHGALVDEYLPVMTDTYLTWGDDAADWLRRRRVAARLHAMGAPRTDRIAQYLGVPARERAERGAPTVVFFTQPDSLDVPAAHHERVAREFLTLLADPGLSICVKLHPADDRRRWTKLAGTDAGRLRVLDAGTDAYDAIKDADYVGAFYSTVLVESMLFARPVFQLNPYEDAVPDYSRRAGCSHVDGGAALREWIGYCEARPDFRTRVLERQAAFARRYFANPGGATAEFYRCIDSLAGLPPGNRPPGNRPAGPG